ncbi:MAG: hypothetical protein IKU61_03865 [Clostridia bacterium]|nr:hypothetical protein [Clostridia bacterium]
MFKRIICITLAVLLLAICAFAAERATLFAGDSVWKEDSRLPFIEADGKGLLPVSVFETFNVKVTLSEKLGSLLLTRGDVFLSYDLGLGRVLDENGVTENADIYRYGGEIYLEPTRLCEKFSLVFETTYASDGYLAARLCDGSETLEFSELLKLFTDTAEKPLPFLYNPTGKTVPGSFMHPIIIMPAAGGVEAIVRLLGNHAATFAISPSKLSSYASVLPAIYAGGHTVAFYMDGAAARNADTFANEIKTANEWLFSFIGKTSKIYVSTLSPKETPNIDGLYKKCCNMHLVSEDLASERVVNITLSESPGYGIFNFSLAGDYQSRVHYTEFFKRFDTFTHLRSMPLSESCAAQ